MRRVSTDSRKYEVYSKEDIVKIIQSISGNVYTVYSDWIKLCAIAIQNAVVINEQREQEYKTIIKKYKQSEVESFVTAFGILQILIEEKFDDYLGSIYMMLENGSKRTGQFFTPYHLSQLVAEVSEAPEADGRIAINEPACGAGANIIAFLEKKSKEGINYQKKYKIVAQDLDWNCVYMCYVQLSLLGAYAVVMQKDTLSADGVNGDNILYTPMYYLSRGGCV